MAVAHVRNAKARIVAKKPLRPPAAALACRKSWLYPQDGWSHFRGRMLRRRDELFTDATDETSRYFLGFRPGPLGRIRTPLIAAMPGLPSTRGHGEVWITNQHPTLRFVAMVAAMKQSANPGRRETAMLRIALHIRVRQRAALARTPGLIFPGLGDGALVASDACSSRAPVRLSRTGIGSIPRGWIALPASRILGRSHRAGPLRATQLSTRAHKDSYEKSSGELSEDHVTSLRSAGTRSHLRHQRPPHQLCQSIKAQKPCSTLLTSASRNKVCARECESTAGLIPAYK